ncbi:caspase activity and apoptosis inhibitor 1 [Brachionichthys hirsutus]|uniref:caspase activity and apoptosis inhibitor 1 n=1 Tax=Brachionichthys hirsutus TaxID=412623 RepID=UPI003604ED37
MLKKKLHCSEKKRKHLQAEDRDDVNKRRGGEVKSAQNTKDDLADRELDRIGSDIEDGGLDLGLPFRPIAAYLANKREMLEQCYHVLGDKKLQKMLPDELKGCGLEEIKRLCWEQLEPMSEKSVIQILAGEDGTSGNGDKNAADIFGSQQDNNVDSTSCAKEAAKTEDPKQEGGGSCEENDVLSINADAYDSDIEGPKEEQQAKAAEGGVKVTEPSRASGDPASNPDPANPGPPLGSQATKVKEEDIQNDIDKSVSEILSFPLTSSKEATEETQSVAVQSTNVTSPVQGTAASSRSPAASQPSIQQLELLELEMRARAIKALMKASGGKNLSLAKNV